MKLGPVLVTEEELDAGLTEFVAKKGSPFCVIKFQREKK